MGITGQGIRHTVQSLNTGTHKEGEEGYLMFIISSCRTQLGTVYMTYQWIGNSDSTSRERRGRCTGIIIIRIHNSYIIRRTRPACNTDSDIIANGYLCTQIE